MWWQDPGKELLNVVRLLVLTCLSFASTDLAMNIQAV